MPEGRQSPPPYRQKPEQISEPASGHAGDQTSREEQDNENPQDMLRNLTSNPPGPMDEEVKRKFSKQPGN